MPTNELLARNIRKLRGLHSMSMENLAAGSGIDKTWLNRMEHGQENASVGQLEQLAKALRVETAELFKQEDAKATQATQATQAPQATQSKRRSRK
jgi:transcriptional regulator with XRE-family HTH domain